MAVTTVQVYVHMDIVVANEGWPLTKIKPDDSAVITIVEIYMKNFVLLHEHGRLG